MCVRGLVLPFKLLLFFCLISTGCSFVQRPKVGQLSMNSLSKFDHTGITSNCASCHDTGKPFAAFPEMGHKPTSGQDCSTCHTPSGWLSAGVAIHNPIPGACNSCHGPGGSYKNSLPASEPFNYTDATYGPQQMFHSFPGLPDCASCHTATPANVGVAWSGGFVFHSKLAPTTCIQCHINERPAATGTIPSHTVAPYSGDCNSCHSYALTNNLMSWKTAFSHTPTPATCFECHKPLPPTTMVYPRAPSRKSSPSAGFNHDPSFGNECASCHTVVTGNIGTSWKGGYFNHSANGIDINNAATSCTPCHVDHGSGPKCADCHNISPPNPNNYNPSNNNFGGKISGG